MSRQYKRSVSIVAFNNEEELTISKLRIRFKVEKDIFGIPNVAKIEVYNLSGTTRSKLEKKYSRILLNCGYEGSESLLFAGTITYIFHNKQRENLVTTIYAADGAFSYEKAFFYRSYSNSVKYPKIFNDVIETFDEVSSGNLQAIPDTENSLYGQTFHAASRDVLDDLASTLDLEWYIENEKLNTIKKGGFINAEILTFNALNGMINSPIITEIGANCQVLLRPTLKIGSVFKIDSISPIVQLGNYYFNQINPTKGVGQYRINRLLHVGDTHGQNWTTAIEASIIF